MVSISNLITMCHLPMLCRKNPIPSCLLMQKSSIEKSLILYTEKKLTWINYSNCSANLGGKLGLVLRLVTHACKFISL